MCSRSSSTSMASRFPTRSSAPRTSSASSPPSRAGRAPRGIGILLFLFANDGAPAESLGRGSATWRYLHDERCLPEMILRAAIRQDRLREGPHGSMWAAHVDDGGTVTGWEERGPDWRGFSTGGSKVLFRLGRLGAPRVCVTEAAIDAMSLAALEGLRDGSLYLSTGGGWSPATEAAVADARGASRHPAHRGNGRQQSGRGLRHPPAGDRGRRRGRLAPPDASGRGLE